MPGLPRATIRRSAVALGLALALVPRPATGQPGGRMFSIGVKSPVRYQVVQRGVSGLADIPIILPDDLKDAKVVSASLTLMGSLGGTIARYVDGKLIGVPPGGPYSIQGEIEVRGKENRAFQVDPVYVGDLWVLAGQSNMQGVGDLQAGGAYTVQPVTSLGMDGKWEAAKEPLHWLVDSPDPVHSGDPATRAERSKEEHRTRTKGAGLGIPFAEALVAETRVPVGLVPCAHGGTSLEQWSPARKGEGGGSLYGSMLRQVKLAGGKVKGVLWYQGESDAMSGGPVAGAYARTFAAFIAAVRDDLGRPDLPFYYVQIGRYVHEGDPKDWNAVQEAQRRLLETVPNTAVVSVVDLELDDAIHVGTAGLRRAGERLAKVALREQYGLLGATTPTLDRVGRGDGGSLVVKFRGVNRTAYAVSNVGRVPTSTGGLQPLRHVAGFSIRRADGRELPLIYEAAVGPARDTVVLKLAGPVPAGASLFYGWGFDPYCNLTDTLDMAVPAFGPIALEGIE